MTSQLTPIEGKIPKSSDTSEAITVSREFWKSIKSTFQLITNMTGDEIVFGICSNAIDLMVKKEGAIGKSPNSSEASEPIDLHWIEVTGDDAARDELAAHYKGFEIRLLVPNGGIIGVTVCGNGSWSAPTEEHKRYHDEDWHIACAKQFIDQLPQMTIDGGSR